MPATLELTDGTTTLDLLGPPYRASQPVRLEPPDATPVLAGQTLRGVHYSPRIVETDLNLRAADVSSLRRAIRTLESLCSVSESRQSIAHGAPVSLRCQLGDADAQNTDQGAEYRVLRGEVVLPPSLLQEPALSTAHAVPGARLRLLVEPFGRLAQVTPAQVTAHNEQDGAATNWLDVTDAGGTHGAKLRLKIADPGGWSGPARMWVARRSGARRADKLFFQAEAGTTASGQAPFVGGRSTWDGSDVFDANASGSGANVARMMWSTRVNSYEVASSLTRAGYVEVGIPGASVPHGLFRALARVRVGGNPFSSPFEPDRYDTESALGFALGWTFGGRRKEPSQADKVHLDETGSFQTIDLGELSIPPMALPEGYSSPDLRLRVHGIFDPPGPFSDTVVNRFYSVTWDVDYVMLLPIDEGAVIVDGVDSADRVLIDTLSDTPGVYLLDAADVVQRYADFTGGPFGLGTEDTRIYVVRDEPGDPSAVRFTLNASYTPLVAGV